jgi:hypothetical protein
VLTRLERAGSGPFQLGGRSGPGLSLARYRGWWGSGLGLGPTLDRIEFEVVPDDGTRVRLLRRFDVEIASELSPRVALSLLRDPLLTAVGARSGHGLGLDRSVRGIENWRPQPLSGVWLAVLGQAG